MRLNKRFNTATTKKIIKHLRVEDFAEDTLLRMVAEKDISLAMDLMNYFGGVMEYIPTPVQICKFAMKKFIRAERDQCKSIRLIALETGLTARQISYLKTCDDSLSSPLPEIPE